MINNTESKTIKQMNMDYNDHHIPNHNQLQDLCKWEHYIENTKAPLDDNNTPLSWTKHDTDRSKAIFTGWTSKLTWNIFTTKHIIKTTINSPTIKETALLAQWHHFEAQTFHYLGTENISNAHSIMTDNRTTHWRRPHLTTSNVHSFQPCPPTCQPLETNTNILQAFVRQQHHTQDFETQDGTLMTDTPPWHCQLLICTRTTMTWHIGNQMELCTDCTITLYCKDMLN